MLEFEERFDIGITKAEMHFEERNEVIKGTNKQIILSSVAEEISCF